MAHRPLATLLQHLRHLVTGTPADQGDSALLEQFATRQDETAFATLLQRHGPLVFEVCRRVLGDAHEAEDAFQATFLVLARKASSLGGRRPLANWLWTVAYRLALRSRALRARRLVRERQVGDMQAEDIPGATDHAELRAVLDDELHRLPEKYRTPVILCYMQGQTNEEAARQLGCPKGTVLSRLARARERLRGRLERRGMALSAAALGQLANSAEAVTPELARSTLQAATRFATGQTVGGLVSADTILLAEGALHAMFTRQLKITAVVLLVLCLGGAGAWLHHALAEKPAVAAAGPTAERPPVPEPPARTDRHGDPLPAGAVARLGSDRLWHGAGVTLVAYTPDGQSVISAADWMSGALRFWDVATGKERFSLKGSQLGISALAVTADGKLAATVGKEPEPLRGEMRRRALMTTLRLTDLATRKELRQLGGFWDYGKQPLALAFAADGRTLYVLSCDGQLTHFDTTTGEQVQRFEGTPGGLVPPNPSGIRSAVVSADGRIFAGLGTDRAVRLWDAATGKELQRYTPPGKGLGLTLSADGKTVVTAGDDGQLRVWDAGTGKETRAWDAKLSKQVCRLALAPDGKTLAANAGTGLGIQLWDTTSGNPIARCTGHHHTVNAFAFSADGKQLVSGSTDHTVRLWHVRTGQEVFTEFGHRSATRGVAFAPDGRTVVTGGSDGTVRLWDWAKGQDVKRLPGGGEVISVAFSPDGRHVASAGYDRQARWWDAASGQELHRFPTGTAQVPRLAVAPDGRTLATADLGKVVRFWDVATGKELRSLPKHQAYIEGIAFAPDGKRLVSTDEMVRIWDVETGKELGQCVGHANGTRAVAFAPNNRHLASGGGDRVVRLWDLNGCRQVGQFTYPEGSSSGVLAVAFSPDGCYLATGSNDQFVRLWDVATGREIRQFKGHANQVESVAFSADGRLIVSGTWGPSVYVWDATGRAPEGTLPACALTAAQTETLWLDLAEVEPTRSYPAYWALVASARTTVAVLGARLRPVPTVDARRLAQLIADLDSQEFAVREKATTELQQLREQAEPALQKLLASQPPLEVRQRAEELLGQLAAQKMPPDVLRKWRAIGVLEQIGSPEARTVLEQLAAGAPDAMLTQDAQRAVRRLSDRAMPGR